MDDSHQASQGAAAHHRGGCLLDAVLGLLERTYGVKL
jgi:hypothetical protein